MIKFVFHLSRPWKPGQTSLVDESVVDNNCLVIEKRE